MTPTAPAPPRTSADLRRAFLDFFRERGHTVVPSAPLVPSDPTMLFTTAGMVQFKPYYTAADVPYNRATSVQKCLRLTDLDNVGRTPRHMTFFEMLGNFSFGPGGYFKADAIAFAWEFVTRVLGLPKDRLYVSIFDGEGGLPRDDEADGLWKAQGVASDHIVALGRKDNFWGPAGGRGACGPSSEIYFDLGERRPPELAPDAFWGERPGDPGDRFMEFWNLVFPQFDARDDGTLKPLARPGIDTGMGLERLALIMQDKRSIFETDGFDYLIDGIFRARGRASEHPSEIVDARVIADHTRAVTFAISEGALPGNEGAGYVLRRLIRRAVTRAHSKQGLGIAQPLVASVGRHIVDRFASHYPELREREDMIRKVLEQEEATAVGTGERGELKLEELLLAGKQSISGEEAFRLHDTYGYSIDKLEFAAAERGVAVDRPGFERAMEEQRRRAREASRFKKGEDGARAPWTTATEGADSEFVGYEQLEVEHATLRRWRPHGERGLDLVLDRTPAYAESGGQVADAGVVIADDAAAELRHVHREDESIVHRVELVSGSREAFLAAAAAGRVRVRIDAAARRATMRHHTATHLLHAALRDTLGTHVRQAGSLVAPDRLRFDYTHFEAPEPAQLERVASIVSEWVLRDRPVSWRVMPLDEAKALGAMALFGEKYGARVRLVTTDGVEDEGIPASLELCGGTHVARTGEIGAFVIVSDASIASGVRRIEALCGHEAVRWLRGHADTLHQVAASLQASPAEVAGQIEKLRGEIDRLRKSQAEAARGGLEAEMERLAREAHAGAGGRWVVGKIAGTADTNAVRDAADRLRGALKSGAAVLAVAGDGKLTFIACVTDDLVQAKQLNAADLVKKVAQVTGGSGGGKPHLALAGGKDAAKLEDALAEARRLLGAALGDG